MSEFWPYLILLLLAAIVVQLRRIRRERSSVRPKQPIISNPEGKRRFVMFVLAALVAVFVIVVIGFIRNPNPVNIYDANSWERASESQKLAFCVKVASKSSKGDPGQLYCDALRNSPLRNGPGKGIDNVVRSIDPGNKILPENGGE
jgi:ABC-type Fe3+ transport system permease subunit